MKKYFLAAYLIVSGLCSAQEVSQSLQVAVNNSRVEDGILKPAFNPELSFYSKNYTQLFSRINSGFDASTAWRHNGPVMLEDKLNISNFSFLPQLPADGYALNYVYKDVDYFAAAVSALLGDTFDKELSFKLSRKK